MNDLLLPAIQKSTSQDLDPYYNLVSLHLKGDVNTGRNYNAFSDASSNNFRLTNNGEVRGSSFSPYGTSWSNSFNGSSATTVTTTAAFAAANEDFTIECWVYRTSITSQMICGWNNNPNYDYFLLGATGNIQLNANNTYTIDTSALSWQANTWYHIAVSRVSGVVKIFRDGNQVGSNVSNSNSFGVAGDIRIADWFTTPRYYFSGYISNFRFVKGIGVYTGNFNVPTSPLGLTQSAGTNIQAIAGSQTKLLTCQGNRFIDASGNATSVTVQAGSPTVSSFSPFLETDTTSGSGYFDGSGDYLSIPGNSAFAFGTGGAGTGDFCLEAWVYPNTISTATFDRIVSTSDYNGSGFDWTLNTNSSSLFMSGTSYGISNVITKAWNHIVYTRSSGVLRGFLNGVLVVYNASVTTNVSAVTELRIGVGYSGSHYNGYINGLRILKGSVPEAYQTSSTTTNTQIFTPPTTSISAVTNTQLLTLQERGAYNTIGFEDESEYQHVITRPSGANVAQGTFSPFSPSGWSVYLDGSATFTAPAGLVSAFAGWGGRTRTWEGWIHRTSTASYTIQGAYAAVAANGRWYININTNNKLEFGWTLSTSTQTAVVSTATIPVGWVHLAVTVDSTNSSATTIYLGINGSVETFTNNNLSTQTSSYGWNSIFGSGQYMAPVFTGNFTGLRWSSNLRYTSNYLPPTQTFANDANTLFLFGQQNRFTDQSANNYTVSISAGTPRVTPFSPFAPVAYDPAVHGGSAYFDGSGDYLTLATTSALSFGTGDWTIEFWLYRTDSNESIIYEGRSTEPQVSPHIQVNPSGVAMFYVSGAARITGTTVIANGWFHVAVSKLSGSTRLFVNGVQEGATYTDSNNYTIGATLYIGGDYVGTANAYLNGYLSGLRVLKGTALYTAAFTPPSGPLPLLGNTSLLLNFTNGGVIDSTGKNVIETVGNSGVVTTLKKYGSGSMYFDGTSDQQKITPKSQVVLGNSDWTVEFWAYTSATPAGGYCGRFIYPSTGFFIRNTSGTVIDAGHTGSGVPITTASGVVVTNTWQHIALAKSGTTANLYVNGVCRATGSWTWNEDLTEHFYIGSTYVGQEYFNGYIDDFRVTRGLARYTGSTVGTTYFTAPTKAHPDRGTLSTLTVDMAAPSSVDYLVVGGGGGGGSWAGGGGGGGGFRTGTGLAVSTTGGDGNGNYTITVGGGGAGATSDGGNGISGSNSIFSTITSAGGGGGLHNTAGTSGGSGGGAGYGTVSGGAGNTPSTSPSQGNNGGSSTSTGAPNYAAAGGGGAGAVGGNASGSTAGAGGAGAVSTISGASVTYAGGGGGSSELGGGAGGAGGGGSGGKVFAIPSGRQGGTANTGGGAGGGRNDVTANGGSGVVILAYPTSFRPLKASLGLVYTIDTVTRPGYRVYKFTAGTGTISW